MSKLELKIIPPLVMAIFALLMWGVTQVTPSFESFAPTANIVSKVFLFAGFAILGVAAFYFLKAKTTINPLHPEKTSSLVTSGLYNFSRNPIYVADVLFLLSWGIYLSNFFAIAIILGFVPYLTRFQIKPEERALEQTFGQDYLAYKSRVRRWI